MADRPIIFSAPMVRALLDGRKTQTRRVLKPQPEHNSAGLWCWPPYGHKVTKRTWRGFCQTDDAGVRQWFSGGHKAMEALPANVGDRLWVRETWATVNSECGPGWAYRADGDFIQPEYDGHDYGAGPSFDYDKYPGEYTMWCSDLLAGSPGHRWRSPIHMPRWASRLTLIVTDVRVQRLQDISEEDAVAEGVIRQDPTEDDEEWNRQWCAEHGTEPSPMEPVWLAPGTRQGYGPRRNDPKWGATPQFAFRLMWDAINAKRDYSWESNPWVAAISFDVVKQNIDALDRRAG